MSYAGRNRVGSSTVTVSQAWAQVAFFQQLANHDRVVDAIRKGSENQTWTIKGSQGGTPFTFTHSDRFTSSFDISYDASFELADLVYLLSTVEGVDVDSIAVDGDVTNGAATYAVSGNEQLVKGEWRKVNNRNPATVRAGGKLQLRVVLRGSDGTTAKVPYSFKIPRRAAGNRGTVYLTGGNDFFSEDFFYDEFGGSKSLSDIKSYVDGLVRNDEIAAQLFIGGGFPGGEECREAGCKGTGEIQKDATARSRGQGGERLQAAQDRRQGPEAQALRVPVRVVVDVTTRTGIPTPSHRLGCKGRNRDLLVTSTRSELS